MLDLNLDIFHKISLKTWFVQPRIASGSSDPSDLNSNKSRYKGLHTLLFWLTSKINFIKEIAYCSYLLSLRHDLYKKLENISLNQDILFGDKLHNFLEGLRLEKVFEILLCCPGVPDQKGHIVILHEWDYSHHITHREDLVELLLPQCPIFQ